MKKKYLAVGIILLFVGTNNILVNTHDTKKTSQSTSISNWLNVGYNKLKDFLNDNIELTQFSKRFFPIYIMNNDDLKGFRGKLRGVVCGTGTEDDPYIISGWEMKSRKLFVLFFHKKDCIHFENIDKHVIIKNNYIHDFNNKYADAIELINCRNVTIEQNIIARSYSGISSYGLDNFISICSIEHNTIYQNIYGITTAYSYDVVVNNTIFNNSQRGITCNNAEAFIGYNNIFSTNYDGIVIIGVDKSIITYNKVYGNMRSGISVGKEILYTPPASIISNNEIFSNRRWGISCWIPMNTVIVNNSIYSNLWDGIYISDSSPTIIDNTISTNGRSGIYSLGYLAFSIQHNNITMHQTGIYSYLSDSLNITNNSIIQNSMGIECQSSHPQIHYNNFEKNSCAVFGDGWMGPVNATWNWWGAANGPSGSGPGDGDPISNHVDYNPWLTTPNPNAG